MAEFDPDPELKPWYTSDKLPQQLSFEFKGYTEKEAKSALVWYSWMIARAEATSGNPRAQQSVEIYARAYRSKIKEHEDLIDIVVDIHRDAIKTGRLNTPIWNNPSGIIAAVL